MYSTTIDAFNYAAVFGVMLGLAIILQVENVAKISVKFVRRWKK